VSLTNPVLKHRKLLCVRFYHCRYIKRGADERGDVANFVETEQIVKSLDGAAVSSFVQVSIVQNYCCKRFPCHLDAYATTGARVNSAAVEAAFQLEAAASGVYTPYCDPDQAGAGT
jgi:hypothetical protein